MNVGRNLSYQLPTCTLRHTGFFLYLIIFWDHRTFRERRKAKGDILGGRKDHCMSGFPRDFQGLEL